MTHPAGHWYHPLHHTRPALPTPTVTATSRNVFLSFSPGHNRFLSLSFVPNRQNPAAGPLAMRPVILETPHPEGFPRAQRRDTDPVWLQTLQRLQTSQRHPGCRLHKDIIQIQGRDSQNFRVLHLANLVSITGNLQNVIYTFPAISLQSGRL